ncbi:MAG: protein-L-isoaspartate(D-aspartate) O-methyltransferase [candidate division WOR-3 bacterium]
MKNSEYFENLRKRLVESWKHLRDIEDERVIQAFLKVPRHFFVPKELMDEAYGDYPLPIGFGQTISQPYMIAYMVQALIPDKNSKVLEIGTGSGYTTAILAELFKEIYTVEIIPELAERAKGVLDRLGYKNIHYFVGDGSEGWPEFAPYDRILVTAAAPEVPPPLVEQLGEGGIIVIPITKGFGEVLYRFVKQKNKLKSEELTYCSFVPLRGKYGFGKSKYDI